MIAESLSHYRILEKLGAGGMGVVYKARDTRLDRIVALKILPDDLVCDPIHKRRFTAEAKAASALNHPNIITIYDIGTAGPTEFIAMEYVAGQTLEASIGRRNLPVAQAVGYAIQIAGALTAAHRAGIVHRDLKPANIIVDSQGHIKLLDFGIAKLVPQTSDATSGDSSPTRRLEETQSALTRPGYIVGTVAYMSPEQLTGSVIDARTDIFSFGIILYEMLTGRRPFGGSSTIETAAQVLREEPPAPSVLVPGLPSALERIIRHCLRKNPDARFQSMADVGHVLEDVGEDLSPAGQMQASASVTASRGSRYGLIAGAAIVLLALFAAALPLIRPAPDNQGPVLTRLTFDSGLTTDPAVSRDGKLLAYASDRDGRGNLDIWVRQLAGGEPVQVTHDPADDSEPHFSPDATRIVYRSNREGGGIYSTSALGGSEPQLLAAGAHAPQFSPDGKWITYHTGEMAGLTRRPMRSKLFLLNLSSGQTQQIGSELAAAYHAIWAPDSKHILFSGSAVAHVGRPTDWYVAAVNNGKARQTGAADVFSGQGLFEIIPHAWADRGEVIFSATLGDSRNIWQLPISPPDWHAEPRANRLTYGTGLESHAVLASVFPPSRLVFSVLSFRINLWTVALDANGVTPTGDAARITNDEAAAGFSSLTRDGDLLVFSSNRSGRTQIWSKDLKTGKEMPVTDGPTDEAPVVTSDGSKFVYQAVEDQTKYVVTSGATSAHPRSRRKIVEGDGWPASWSPDGAWLFYSVRADRWGIEAVHGSSDRKYVVFQHPGFDLTSFYPSPDNRWAVSSAYEDPVSRILIAPLRELTTIKPADWVSIADDAAEHDRPIWSSDGTLVYYTSFRDGFRCIWAQRLDNDSKRPSGPAVPVYHSHSARMSLQNAGQNHFKIAVARDRLVFNMGELRGNLWMATLPK